MKKTITILAFLMSTFIFAQITTIPDPNFEQALIDLSLDDVIDGGVLTANINTITTLDVSNKNIADLTGIEDFVALIKLYCYDNLLTSIDVSQNINIVNFFCGGNQLTTLDVSQLTALSQLLCEGNLLTSLDVSNNNNLNRLSCAQNQLTSIDISMHPNFLILNCSENSISNLNLTQNPNLYQLSCDNNQLTSLDLSQNINLSYIFCNDNLLTELDLTSNASISSIRCQHNQLTSLNIQNENNTNINDFNASNNPSLTCIFVDDAVWSTANWSLIDNSSSFVENQTACDTLSTYEIILENSIQIYPNPIADNFTIQNSLNIIIDSIEIYNSLGKLIYQSNQVKNNISIDHLLTGLYTVKITNRDQFINKRIIIK